MAIKIAISLTALSLIQIGMAEVWDRKGSAPIVGQDRQAHYLFIPHHCRITARWVGRGVVARLVWWRWFSTQYEAETFVFSRIYCNIRKPLMPIRYPIAFRGMARLSGCSAWRLKVPKIEHLTHPKPYIVPKPDALPKPFACFSLICSSRNLMSCRNSVFFRNLLIVSALFVQVETLCRAETRCFSETFCLFQPYLLKPKPSFFVELGAVVHQRETSARFCHQRNLQAFFVTFCLFAFWRN